LKHNKSTPQCWMLTEPIEFSAALTKDAHSVQLTSSHSSPCL